MTDAFFVVIFWTDKCVLLSKESVQISKLDVKGSGFYLPLIEKTAMISQDKGNLQLMFTEVRVEPGLAKQPRQDSQNRRKRMAIRQIQLAFRLGYDF